MSPWLWLAVAGAGAVGAPLRYVIDVSVSRKSGARFPYGTMVVNLTGALVLGLLTGLVAYHALPSIPKLILGVGLCGAYTTFSTFELETVVLATEGERLSAAANVVASVTLGCIAAGVGIAVASV